MQKPSHHIDNWKISKMSELHSRSKNIHHKFHSVRKHRTPAQDRLNKLFSKNADIAKSLREEATASIRGKLKCKASVQERLTRIRQNGDKLSQTLNQNNNIVPDVEGGYVKRPKRSSAETKVLPADANESENTLSALGIVVAVDRPSLSDNNRSIDRIVSFDSSIDTVRCGDPHRHGLHSTGWRANGMGTVASGQRKRASSINRNVARRINDGHLESNLRCRRYKRIHSLVELHKRYH